MSVAERFFAKVAKSASCWFWTASVGTAGYGQFGDSAKGRPIGAHRVAWELANGPIPAGLFVCHKCDVKLCVNPAHLWIGTAADNNADMAKKGRAYRPQLGTHCPSGHAYDGANTHTTPDGEHYCMTCKRENLARWRVAHPNSTREYRMANLAVIREKDRIRGRARRARNAA